MNKNLALVGRILGIVRNNPEFIPTALRMEYRHRWGIDADRRRQPGRSGPPTNLSIVLSMRCNLACVMCRQIRGPEEGAVARSWYDFRRELPLEVWVSLLDQVASFRPWLFVTGGEPLLYPRFKEFVEEARKRRLLVHLQTNGTLLAGVADFVVSMGVAAVNISLDGPPDIHDRVRGKAGTFQRVQDGVEALLEARKRLKSPGPIISFNFTISKTNLQWLEEIVPLAVRLNADCIQIQHTMFDSPENVAKHNAFFTAERVRELGLEIDLPSISEDEYYQNELGPQDLPRLAAGLEKARAQAKGRIKLHFMPGIPPHLLQPYYCDLNHPFIQGCDHLWKTARILSDGTLSPCLNIVMGNIAEQPFMDLWNGPRMQRLRGLVADRLLPGCARCCQRHYTKASRAF
jgi:MoaA/NifB/PqqE/SkfB family radical SAM enzyme